MKIKVKLPIEWEHDVSEYYLEYLQENPGADLQSFIDYYEQIGERDIIDKILTRVDNCFSGDYTYNLIYEWSDLHV